ncbi:DUF3418 domain-containing protein [Kitasatospora paracochleata]|uniref:DUF3418 domain-containing protein n=1 Tax=Kitasatospora paracochleata TaxID=58354 RepID=UPI0038996D7C
MRTQARRAPDGRRPGRHLGQARRMLETYRVRLWAQQLGTAQTVGDARIRKDAESVAGPTRRPVLRSGRGRGRRSRGVRRSR